ncbi:MAG: branched-chain amino acid ABC transporter permease [Dehalococcoidia bacterium]|nr:branched-chain amino acid ABC transporter permease [Dehalococcoidia bacterium]
MDIIRGIFKKSFVPGLISLILLVLLATLPVYGSAYNVILLTAILMYVIITVSWVIFSGPTGYISLAPAAFFGVGIYTMAILGKTLPLLSVVVIAGLITFILAFLVGALTLRLRGIYFAIFTFGLVVLIQQLLLFWEINITGTRGRFVVLIDNTTIYYVMLGIFVVLMLTTYFIRRSKYGLALQSIGENEEAAAHMGVNVTLVKVITFAISAIFMGAAGAIMATRWTYIDPYVAFSPLYSFLPVLMAIFGGMGQLYGPVLGAAIFAYLEEILITKFPYYYMLTFGIILVVVILYLPNGLVGLVQKWRKGGKAEQHANT